MVNSAHQLPPGHAFIAAGTEQRWVACGNGATGWRRCWGLQRAWARWAPAVLREEAVVEPGQGDRRQARVFRRRQVGMCRAPCAVQIRAAVPPISLTYGTSVSRSPAKRVALRRSAAGAPPATGARSKGRSPCPPLAADSPATSATPSRPAQRRKRRVWLILL